MSSVSCRCCLVLAGIWTGFSTMAGEGGKPPWLQPYRGAARSDIDATSLRKKALCGYQGWFRAPGDGTKAGWVHWSRDRRRLTPETLTFEMWPDLSEFSPEEKFAAPGFTHPDGSQAFLFSSVHPKTIDRHFDWMARYGLDGVLVQRFVVGLGDPVEASRVLGYARQAANRTGRVFAVEYDMTGMPADRLFDRLTTDWKWLVDEMRITADPRYLHHQGKPVLAVYGFFSDRFEAATAHRILDFFLTKGKYQVHLIGGCPWTWRKEKDREWARAYRRFDVLCPWNVGNYYREGGRKYAATDSWAGDQGECRRAGMDFMPVAYPGFSWDNLMRKPPGTTLIPRLGGEFLWRQFAAAADLKVEMIKVAMFDEVDEATAIFKISAAPPREAHFVGLEGRPSDWYLRLTGEGTRLLHGKRPNSKTLPLRP